MFWLLLFVLLGISEKLILLAPASHGPVDDNSPQTHEGFDNVIFDESQRSRARELITKCDLCATKWLLVIATGRSGSTTILNMLNILPHVNNMGEDKGQLKPFVTLSQDLNYTQSISKPNRHDAWYHFANDIHGVYCLAQKWLKSKYPVPNDTMYFGFKEIRYNNVEDLDFIEKAFPCAHIILNTRQNVTAQAQSAFQQGNEQSIYKHNHLLRTFYESQSRQQKLWFTLEEFSLESFNSIIRWLELPERCEYNRVMVTNSNSSYSLDYDSTAVTCS